MLDTNFRGIAEVLLDHAAGLQVDPDQLSWANTYMVSDPLHDPVIREITFEIKAWDWDAALVTALTELLSRSFPKLSQDELQAAVGIAVLSNCKEHHE